MNERQRREIGTSAMEKIVTDCALFECEKTIKALQDELQERNKLLFLCACCFGVMNSTSLRSGQSLDLECRINNLKLSQPTDKQGE